MPSLLRVLKHIEMTTCERCGARYLWSPFAKDHGCLACKRREVRLAQQVAAERRPYVMRRLEAALERANE